MLPSEGTPPSVNHHTAAVASIEAASQAREKRLQLVSVVEGESVETLLSQLPQFMSEGCWVAVEQCHLCNDWKEMLESLFQVSYFYMITVLNFACRNGVVFE